MNNDTILRASQQALSLVSPLLGHLIGITWASADRTEQAAKDGSIDDLRMEEQRQELTLRMAERQAKVAQELAIARRIENADDVEIEEFYDVNGSAHAGVKTNDEGFAVGLSGQGQKVTRRVYRFKQAATAVLPNQ